MAVTWGLDVLKNIPYNYVVFLNLNKVIVSQESEGGIEAKGLTPKPFKVEIGFTPSNCLWYLHVKFEFNPSTIILFNRDFLS